VRIHLVRDAELEAEDPPRVDRCPGEAAAEDEVVTLLGAGVGAVQPVEAVRDPREMASWWASAAEGSVARMTAQAISR
jgi:hypothetical protein